MTSRATHTDAPLVPDQSFGDLDWLFRRFADHASRDAVICDNSRLSYAELVDSILLVRKSLQVSGVSTGDCVAVEADFSAPAICAFLAVASLSCVVVPLSPGSEQSRQQRLTSANANFLVSINSTDQPIITALPRSDKNHLLMELEKTGSAGLILFSSGSTGEPKAALHRLNPMIEQHRRSVPAYRTLGFLLFDHIGGLNTLFYSLANTGVFILPQSNTVRDVVLAMSRHAVELFPTTPTFLNLLLASGIYQSHEFDSWKLTTYGTEPMPESTLARLNATFPNVIFKQTYGSTELGILPTRSQSSASVLIAINPDKLEIRIENHQLLIRTDRRMLGYLNAPDPFDENGWMNTGDLVETHENYIRIPGREDELINVGGLKVHPMLVEDVINEHSEVIDASVFGQKHALLGHTVVARVQFNTAITPVAATRMIRKHCRGKLDTYMIPSKVIPVDSLVISDRFKKVRP